jgi:hypothetical protein
MLKSCFSLLTVKGLSTGFNLALWRGTKLLLRKQSVEGFPKSKIQV